MFVMICDNMKMTFYKKIVTRMTDSEYSLPRTAVISYVGIEVRKEIKIAPQKRARSDFTNCDQDQDFSRESDVTIPRQREIAKQSLVLIS